MTSSPPETMLSLRAQIKDNFRYIYGSHIGDPVIVVATHDNLYWAIVQAKDATEFVRTISGHKSEEGALQDMAQDLSDKVWQTAKDNQITLSE